MSNFKEFTAKDAKHLIEKVRSEKNLMYATIEEYNEIIDCIIIKCKAGSNEFRTINASPSVIEKLKSNGFMITEEIIGSPFQLWPYNKSYTISW
jgi:hypothetical protein